MYPLGLAASIAAVVGTSHHLDAGSVFRAVVLVVVLFALVVLILAWLRRRILRKRRSVYSVGDDEWMSKLGSYSGPTTRQRDSTEAESSLNATARSGRNPRVI